MNKIIRTIENGNAVYTCIAESGTTIKCTRWYEKKTGEWYVKLPKENETGREYIREKKITSDEYEFETKTTGPRVLGPQGNWRSRLTEAELKELKEAEATIERLKQLGLSRKPEKKTIAQYEKELAEMKALYEKLLAQNKKEG